MTTATQTKGKSLQVFGPVVDVQFPEGLMPNLCNAITVVGRQRGIAGDRVVPGPPRQR
ncbi:MAG TPA: hypothetical protein VF384_12130 [Planctomycetota bacterium]